MLWEEFKTNTKCKDTEYNHKVYESIEALYMAKDAMTKEEAYKAGRLLIDNSETEQERKHREECEERIKAEEENIRYYSDRIETLSLFCRLETTTLAEFKEFSESIKTYKRLLKESKQEIKKQKWLLGI